MGRATSACLTELLVFAERPLTADLLNGRPGLALTLFTLADPDAATDRDRCLLLT